MEILDKILNKVNIFNKMNEATKSGLVLSLSGTGIGEKICSILAQNKKVIYVASDAVSHAEIRETLKNCNIEVSDFFVNLTPPIYSRIQDNSTSHQMVKSLYDFVYGKSNILLLTSENLLYKYHQKISLENSIKLEVGQDVNFNDLIQKLIKIGYKKCEKVEKIGDFCVKGDILDIFSCNYENSIRLDFFGDQLEKIYLFDSFEMQKINDLQDVLILPTKLNILNEQDKKDLIDNIKNSSKLTNFNGDASIKNSLLISQICEDFEQGLIDEDIAFLSPFFKNQFSIFDIVNNNVCIMVDEPKKLFDDVSDVYKSAIAGVYDYYDNGELLPEHKDYLFDVSSAINFKPNIIFSNITQNIFNVDVKDYFRTIGSFNYCYDYKKLISDIRIYEMSKYKVVLFAGSESSRSSICEFLLASGIAISDELKFETSKFQVIVSSEYFSKSCSFLDSGVVVIGTDDLIKKTKSQVSNISKSKNKKHNVFYLPKVGDYVVHEIHGVGKCISLQKMNLNGTEKDYFVIEYSGGDKLYLPSEQTNLISAFMGGDVEPKLNKIGGEQFANIKQKVKDSVSKLAINLLDIYAKRENTKGFVYSPDDYLFDEFEKAFPYTETDDQLSAIEDIKKDMHSEKIMDRLICGDVGYGKTEVALRAIYKAVVSGKQVAFLCPTTILSQQHYSTAKQRFKDFMVDVAVLNRFKTKQQEEQILKDVTSGKVNVLIGTHRLLSDDVVFKDLGLLVLDEEQRFGVKDKEKIKDLKKNIDVLTLSATPIPRTLNMALTGIRDISIIETPPKERIAVKTFVTEESDTLISNACKKELLRGGQILFVYNRVEGILKQVERLKELLPDARIGVAHGQMPRKILEDTILKLYNQEYDILVATTLIESGIDLPLANTLIVLDADRLGLSELYQLRGRIGRSNKVAYAYFTYNPSKVLTNDAYKRLDAILEYTELGSGFKIAMRDLEIRGAGNILGKEQHGHLEKVGYDMYCKLLQQAVKELKGEKIKESKPIKVDILLSANISSSYVESEDERIKLYSTISNIASEEEFNRVKSEIYETYGQIPNEVQNLLKIAYVKNLGIKAGLKRILIDSNNIKLYLYKTQEIMSDKLNKTLVECGCGVLKFEDVPVLEFNLGMATNDKKLDFILNFLLQATND